MKKRFVAILLALSVMLTLLPGSALAAEAGGEGTETLPPAVETETGGEAETEPPYEEEPEITPAAGAEDPVPEEPAPATEEPEEQDAAVLLAESADGYTLVSTADELLQALWSSEPVYIRLAADIKLSNPLSLNEGKSVTLDLNGHELSVSTVYGGGQTLQVRAGASLTVSNGMVTSYDDGSCAIVVDGGTLAMEGVTVAAAVPVLCRNGGNSSGVVSGTISYIRGCRLEGTALPEGVYSSYNGLQVWGGHVDEITNTVITGGLQGIDVQQNGYIGAITSTAGGAQRTTITGREAGIAVRQGEIGRIESCDILYTGTIEEGKVSNRYGLELADGFVSSIAGCKINGVGLNNYIGQNGDERVGKIESLSDCEIQGPVVVYGKIDSITNCTLSQGNDSAANALIEIRGGDVGTIENCTLEIPSVDGVSSRQPGNGVSVNAGRVGTISGCQFTSNADQLLAIFIGEASVDVIENNTFTVPASSTSGGPCDILNISFTGTLGKLGVNEAGETGGQMVSSGIIKEITAPGTWDEAKRQFTAASGNWNLWNNGTIGEAVRASTEAELRSALERGSAHLTLGADIGLSSPLTVDGNLRSFILDLSGHTLTGTVNITNNNPFIRNGTIAASTGSGSPTVSVTNATLEMEQVTVTGIRPLAVASTNDGDSSTRGTYLSLQDCQIIGNPVPAGEQQPEIYSGILIEGSASVGVQDSTVTGGFVGIRQNAAAPQDETERYISLYINGSDVGSLSALPGACAIENVSGVIDGVYNTTLRTADGADTAAIRNRAAGTIRCLVSDIRTVGSNAIYNEGKVEDIRANGEWKNDNTVFEAVDGWVLYQGSSSGLTVLKTPTDLRWGDGTDLPTGALTWDMGENGGEVAVKVWRREKTHEIIMVSYILEVSPEAGPVLDENLLYDASLYFPWSSGTYYFTVQALGDYKTTASSAIAVSPDWTYTGPDGANNALRIEEAVPWNGQQIAFKSVDADLAMTYAYRTELLCNVEGESEVRLIATNTDLARPEKSGPYMPTSLTLEWFKDRIKEAGSPRGQYYLRVTAISMDVNTAWNGEHWTQHTIYPSTVQGTLEGLAGSTTDPAEIQSAVASLGTEKLLDAMTEENGGDEIAGMLTKLEKKMTNVETTVTVTGDIGNSISMEGVSVVGAALNANTSSTSGGSVEVKLQIGAASATAPAIPEGMYRNSVNFSMTMTGVTDPKNLAVPVQITLPVPAGINPDKLVVLHHRSDGTTETVPCKIKTENGSSYAVFCVTGFSDFTMTESVSGAVLGRLTVNEDGSGSVKASGSAVTLAVASYDVEGKMLGMQTFSVLGSQMFAFRLPQGQTVKAFVLEDGSWRPVTLAEAR